MNEINKEINELQFKIVEMLNSERTSLKICLSAITAVLICSLQKNEIELDGYLKEFKKAWKHYAKQ